VERLDTIQDFTIIGLERYLPNTSVIRRRHKMQSIKGLCDEQDVQHLEGIFALPAWLEQSIKRVVFSVC
jgi:hypothetical protein